MSSEWRYLSEARGHLVEIYQSFLGMPMRHGHWHNTGYDDWFSAKMNVLMGAVAELEGLGSGVFVRLLDQWSGPACYYISMTPSRRAKFKYADPRDRVLFNCVALWYMQWAIQWLEDRLAEDTLVGGCSYRTMTSNAAAYGARRVDRDKHACSVFPEEWSVLDNLERSDPRRD